LSFLFCVYLCGTYVDIRIRDELSCFQPQFTCCRSFFVRFARKKSSCALTRIKYVPTWRRVSTNHRRHLTI
jgi:hypothetical protein